MEEQQEPQRQPQENGGMTHHEEDNGAKEEKAKKKKANKPNNTFGWMDRFQTNLEKYISDEVDEEEKERKRNEEKRKQEEHELNMTEKRATIEAQVRISELIMHFMRQSNNGL
jgi:hypothetical protein